MRNQKDVPIYVGPAFDRSLFHSDECYRQWLTISKEHLAFRDIDSMRNGRDASLADSKFEIKTSSAKKGNTHT